LKLRSASRAGTALAVLGLATAQCALARPGGGGHGGIGHAFHHGHFGGGNFGGGIIGLVIVVLLFWYVIRRVLRDTSGVATLTESPLAREALGVVLGAAAGRGIGTFEEAEPQRAPVVRPGVPGAVGAIRAQDPAFEIETFLQRAELTFFLVKRGLQKNAAAAIRPYLNDAVFGVVSRNIEQMTAQHQRALMESLNVRSVHLAGAACSEQGQALKVHFDLVYRAKTLDDSNRVLADEGEDRRHGERWTFVRAPTARTPESGGVTASRCPACGAELRLNLDGTCIHCRASVTNGMVDWVVADVQPAPFLGYASDPMLGNAAPTVEAGIADLRSADSGFDQQAFLARAKTAFMALQEAWSKPNMEAARAFLSPGAYFAWSVQLETMAAEGRRNLMEGVTVNGIEPIRVVHGRVFDDLTVRISAAAADYEVDQTGQIVFGDRTVRPFTEDWTFQRSVGVASSNKAGTLESTCPNCGAPLALTQIGECRYCKAAVTSGKFDWVVSRIEQEDDTGISDDGYTDIKAQLASQVGGAIVGGLLASLFSNRQQ